MRKNIIMGVILTFVILFIPNYSYSWTSTTRWDPANMDGWYAWDSGFGMPTVGGTLSPAQPDGNTKALRVKIPAGSDGGGNQYGGASVIFTETNEVWAQFYVLWSSNYIWHTVEDKFGGWECSTGACGNMIQAWGNGKGEMMMEQQGATEAMNNPYGFTPNHYSPVKVKDHWYKVVQHLSMNTPGVKNGTYEMWVDDQLVMSYTNVGYRDTGNNGGFTKFRHLVVWGGIDHRISTPSDMFVYYGTSIVSSQNIFNQGTFSTLIGKEPLSPSKITIK
jgi:hypothetical protein